MKADKYYYHHVRVYNRDGLHPKGGMTIMMWLEGEQIRARIAYCSLKEVYNKRTGREIVNGRTENTFQLSLPYKEQDVDSTLEKLLMIDCSKAAMDWRQLNRLSMQDKTIARKGHRQLFVR